MNRKYPDFIHYLMRIITPVLCFLFLTTCISSGKKPDIRPIPIVKLKETVDYYLNSPLFQTGIWSIYAEYLDSGQPVFDLNSSKVLAVGSNMKIITCAAALEILGPDYQYYTDIFYDGYISDETLYGNLYIYGSGDPAFLSGIIPSAYSKENISQLLYRELTKRGIKCITGSVVADNFLFKGSSIPDDWRWLDLGTHYGAGTSALCINENMVFFSFKADEFKVDLLEISPEIPYMRLINLLVPAKSHTSINYQFNGLPKSHTITVSGTIPADSKIYIVKAAIPEPALLAAHTITDELIQSDIRITGQPALLEKPKKYDYRKKLITIPSPCMKEIIYYLLKQSINLYAEQLCITLGLRNYGIASTKNGIRVYKSFLKNVGMPMEGIQIYDGSGLSRFNKISTKLIVRLLKHIAKSSLFPYFYNGLGIAGDPDDISFFTYWGQGTEIAFNARIKSGSLKWVKAHSGYVTTGSGRMIAYSMIVNNYNGSPVEVEEAHQDILLRFAQCE